jgi:hypothetical protein
MGKEIIYIYKVKKLLKNQNPIEASHTMESGYILWDTCRWALGKSYWKEHPNPNTKIMKK